MTSRTAAFSRIVRVPLTLSDGTYLPKGTHIVMPFQAICNDEAVYPSPQEFDGLRFYRKRLDPKQSHLHQFTTTSKDLLNFGHGKQACPGRFFANLEIKNILVRILQEYDCKLPDGEKRPANFTFHGSVFPDPKARILFKRRERKSDDITT